MDLESIINNTKIGGKRIKWILFGAFVLVVLVDSWNSDDAYHAYIMAHNLVEGNGFVYNVGYRVTASTCPLYTLFTALIYFLLGSDHMYFAGIIGGVLCSAAAVYILEFKICKTTIGSVLMILNLLLCYSFMSYTSAGLENPQMFLLATVFVLIFSKSDGFTSRDLFWLAFVLSLLAVTRVDSVLVFVPAICTGYLFYTKIGFGKRVGLGICGLLPFIGWEFFSVIYYGFPFPNTMYVKLNTGFPESDYLTRGIDYLARSFFTDLGLLIVPMAFLVYSLYCKNRKMLSLSIGCFLYFLYVVYIGGDFMVGRHLTLPYFVSLMGIVETFNEKEIKEKTFSLNRLLICFLTLGLISLTIVRPMTREALYNRAVDLLEAGVADEKDNYLGVAGLVPYVFSLVNGGDTMRLFYYNESTRSHFQQLREEKKVGEIETYLAGIKNYYVQQDGNLYLTDEYGLMDPLLSHLPAVREENWRIGHMKREIPEGYAESVAAGKNLIVNESLHEYYDKILLIITGDLWDKERLSTIVKMNLGEYDYLIEDYLNAK